MGRSRQRFDLAGLSRPVDVSKFGLIYAGAQKNMGCAGVTVVIIRKDVLDRSRTDLPSIFRYTEVAKQNSLQNTVTTFAVYMLRNVLQWLKEQGGLGEMELRTRRKAELLYDAIDRSGGYYTCPAEAESRSTMNVVYTLRTEELTDKFVESATRAGLVGLKGHRQAGGIRASIYNAMSIEGVEKLAGFMESFRAANA